MNKLIPTLAICLLPFVTACEKKSSADALGRSLTIVLKTDQVIAPGETDDVLVTVSRKELVGPVDVRFLNLPTGVSVKDSSPIPADDAMRTYTLVAIPSASRVDDHRVIVSASLHGVEVREGFNLTVKPKN